MRSSSPWPQIEAAMDGDLRHDARWIFHIGHVGSTLVSRLLGELPGVLALREPRLLRDLALTPARSPQGLRSAGPELMSRSFAAEEFACVKATSFVSEIAAELVPPSQRALFMFASPRNYIASILAGENSVRGIAHRSRPRAPSELQHRAPVVQPRSERSRARRGRLGVRDDRARSRGRSDARPANRMGRLRRDARGYARRTGACRRFLRLRRQRRTTSAESPRARS